MIDAPQILPQLPPGWFSPDDIAVYRYIYSTLVPANSRVAEIGVYRGRSLCSVADIIKQKALSVIAVDLFAPYYADKDLDRLITFVDSAREWGIYQQLSILSGHSTTTARIIGNAELSFAFIDADHNYESVKSDIDAWRPKLKPSAYLAGHDYYIESGVKQAVDELCTPLALWPNSSIWLTKN